LIATTSAFHLLRPAWLFALIPLLVLILILYQKQKSSNSWLNVCDNHLLKYLLIEVNRKNAVNSPLYWLAISWFIAVIALVGPTWKKLEVPLFKSNDSKVVGIDLSISMNAQDLKPSRVIRAKYKLMDILKRNKEGQIGLIAFAVESYLVSPLTEDAATIKTLVPELKPEMMPVNSRVANITSAIKKAESVLNQSGVRFGKIILITDSKPSARAFVEASELHEKGMSLSIISVGTKGGAPVPSMNGGFIHERDGSIWISTLEEAGLKRLASTGGGKYRKLTADDTDLNSILSSKQTTSKELESISAYTNRWKDEGHWFILLMLPFVLLMFRRGAVSEILR